MPNSEPANHEPPSLWRLVGVGTTMAVLVAGGMLIGLFIDSRAHTVPVFTMVGLAVGITATCFYAYAKFRRFWS
ncbi:MAG TPA: AtpZ/AtpI family protein [Pseudonocardiaceae bacterium]|nr:AtpZ/AtpI family protein [Pseudonocardiaceae bacterium]